MKKKIFKILGLFSVAIIGFFSLSSCSIFGELNKPVYPETDSASVEITATNDGKDESSIVSGDVIAPSDISMQFSLKSLQKSNVYNQTQLPSTGTPNILVIPLDLSKIVTSTPFSANATNKGKIEKAFFGETTDASLSFESLNSFYKKSSFGKLDIKGTVLDWIDVSTLTNSSGSKNYSSVNQINNENEVINIIGKVLASQNIDRTQYDNDKDGIIDGVWVVYNYYDYQTAEKNFIKGLSDNYWAYTFWNQDSNASLTKPDFNVFAWASFDFLLESGNNYVDAHTFIHETGHMMGLNDYYDYSSTCAPGGRNDMMDCNVCDHNSYSKMLLGRTKPYLVTGDCAINLASSSLNEDSCIVIPYKGYTLRTTSDGKTIFNPFDEYILVEYYTPENLNYNDTIKTYSNGIKGINGKGFKVFHVDNRLAYITTSNLTNKLTASWYNNENLNNTNPTFMFISNTFSGSYSESGTIDSFGSEISFSKVDFTNAMAELTLIDSTNSYSYNSCFTSNSFSGKELVAATTASLFKKGDGFNFTTYKKYFSKTTFNNGKTFASTISFN